MLVTLPAPAELNDELADRLQVFQRHHYFRDDALRGVKYRSTSTKQSRENHRVLAAFAGPAAAP